MPSTIQGRRCDLYLSPMAASVAAGTGRFGSVVGSGTFIAAISAMSQSIG